MQKARRTRTFMSVQLGIHLQSTPSERFERDFARGSSATSSLTMLRSKTSLTNSRCFMCCHENHHHQNLAGLFLHVVLPNRVGTYGPTPKSMMPCTNNYPQAFSFSMPQRRRFCASNKAFPAGTRS